MHHFTIAWHNLCYLTKSSLSSWALQEGSTPATIAPPMYCSRQSQTSDYAGERQYRDCHLCPIEYNIPFSLWMTWAYRNKKKKESGCVCSILSHVYFLLTFPVLCEWVICHHLPGKPGMRQVKDSEICHLSSIGMKESWPIHQCSQSSRKTMIVMIISTDNQLHC